MIAMYETVDSLYNLLPPLVRSNQVLLNNIIFVLSYLSFLHDNKHDTSVKLLNIPQSFVISDYKVEIVKVSAAVFESLDLLYHIL